MPIPFFKIHPLHSAGSAAVRYVPLVLFNRFLAFARLLVITHLLGAAGQAQLGLYQPALELINWIVPIAMFGLGDIAERYITVYLREGRLQSMLSWHFRRILTIGVAVVVLGAILTPWISLYVFPAVEKQHDSNSLMYLALINVLILAVYQWLVGVLRGLRAYSAAAGMETLAAILLLLFSAVAAAPAFFGTASSLLIAYGISNLLPLMLYGLILTRWIRRHHEEAKNVPDAQFKHHNKSFGILALIRLLLVMTFGFGVFWMIGFDARGPDAVAEFSVPWRITQLLGYAAVTLWSSGYAIAAAAWSHGRYRFAKVQMDRMARLGFSALLLAGASLVALIPFWQRVFPAIYADAVAAYLPSMTGVFFLFGVVGYISMWGDLHEKPAVGLRLWAMTLTLMILIFFCFRTWTGVEKVLTAVWIGLAAAILLMGTLQLHYLKIKIPWRNAVLTLTASAFLLSGFWSCIVIAGILLTLICLTLIRPSERRALQKRFSPPSPLIHNS